MSQRERLRKRRLPPTQVALRVDFSPDADAAQVELESALRALSLAEVRNADLTDLQDRVGRARAEMAAYVEVLNVHTIPPERYEELIGEHPPSEKQRADGAQWNSVSFVPALLAECIGVGEDDPMSAEDWAEFVSTPGQAAMGELNALFNACLLANDRSPDVHVGKGFGAETRS